MLQAAELAFVLIGVMANLSAKPLLLPLPAGRPSPFERLVSIRYDLVERICHAGRIIFVLNLILATELLAVAYLQTIVPWLSSWQPTPVFFGIGFALYLLTRVRPAIS